MSAPNLNDDTIVAISTPPGRGGIGIVRLSGPEARTIAEPLLRLRNPLAPAQARFAEVIDTEGETLDEAVVTWFAAPASYTTENIVEIASHGSPVLLDYLLRQCIARGARLAEPGEFTQRAFFAGRLDLTQAEAVNDLIEASTLHQARIAAQQLGGSLSRQITPIKDQLIALIAALEAGIDFAEDDIDTLPSTEIANQINTIQATLTALEQTFSYGRIVRDGFTLAIVGRPNAGKSSLFNRLIERDRAIVTATPGTTRDLVTERVSLNGIPVELIDTAGLRQSTDEAETIGIAKSREIMAEADIVLLVIDATSPPHHAPPPDRTQQIRPHHHRILGNNKPPHHRNLRPHRHRYPRTTHRHPLADLQLHPHHRNRPAHQSPTAAGSLHIARRAYPGPTSSRR
jgi:tRNA modification GTPase